MSWEMADEGWGRKAVDFASIAEPSNAREYVFVHSQLGIEPGHWLLDVACGSGLAIELARLSEPSRLGGGSDQKICDSHG